MFPYFNLLIEKIYVFPLIMSFAFMSCVGFFLIRSAYKKEKLKEFIRIVCVTSLVAIIGGKLTSAISLFSQGKGTFWECLVHSGNVFYGCFIAGTIMVVLLSKHYNFEYIEVLDVCASLLPLGQAIGRIGCFCNGCCYGVDYSGFGSVVYPVMGIYKSVFPTWFVESIFCFVLFLLLQFVLNRLYRGVLCSIYLISYSVFRFFIEFLRGDSLRGTILFLSTSQFIGIFILGLGITILIVSLRNKDINSLIFKKLSWG